MGQTKQLRAIDGFAFGAYEAMPSSKPRGGIVVIQEIFGVNSHIRNVCDGYAAAGYAAIAPQIFDRVERNVELGYEPKDMTRGVEIARGKLKMEQTLQDLQAADRRCKALRQSRRGRLLFRRHDGVALGVRIDRRERGRVVLRRRRCESARPQAALSRDDALRRRRTRTFR